MMMRMKLCKFARISFSMNAIHAYIPYHRVHIKAVSQGRACTGNQLHSPCRESATFRCNDEDRVTIFINSTTASTTT